MFIAVKNMTDLKSPQPCHGKSLARLARECFTSHQALIVNFDGVGAISQGFLQELFLPLVAEYYKVKQLGVIHSLRTLPEDYEKTEIGRWFTKQLNLKLDLDNYAMLLIALQVLCLVALQALDA